MNKTKLDSTSEQNILNMLMESSVISSDQMSKINSTSAEIGKSKLETAFELNFANENEILKILSTTYSLPIIDLQKYKIDQKIKKIIDTRYIVDHSLVPFEISDETLKIAIADGSKLSLMKNLKTMTKMEPELYAASISNINEFIERLTKTDGKKTSEHNVKIEKIEKNKDELVDVGEEVIVFGNKLIADAINLGASDIHIESFRNSATIRFREDGILHKKDKYSKFLRENYNAVVNRVKMMSKLDIAEKRKPRPHSRSLFTLPRAPAQHRRTQAIADRLHRGARHRTPRYRRRPLLGSDDQPRIFVPTLK